MGTEGAADDERTAYGLAQDEGHRALGRYVDAFAGMVRMLASNIRRGMQGHPTVAAMTLGIMSAGELERVHRGVINMWVGEVPIDKADTAALNALLNQVKKAIEVRNDYMHGDWLIGYGSSDAPGVPLDPKLLRWKPNAKDGPTAHRDIPVSSLDAESDRLVEMAACLLHLGTWFGLPDRQSLAAELDRARGFAQNQMRIR